MIPVEVVVAVEAVVDLQFSAREGRGCTVVWVAGELDRDTRAQLQDFLQDVVDVGARQVVLDFAEVPFMDSSGLGLLVDALKLLRAKGGRLCVAAVQEPVRNLLALSAVDRVVEVYESVEAAEDDMPPAA
jgi:anti-sigma B factor antagonist